MVCLVSPIVDIVDRHNCQLASPVRNFATVGQCESYLKDEADYLDTVEGQASLSNTLPAHNENKWKLRGVCTKVAVDQYITQVKS